MSPLFPTPDFNTWDAMMGADFLLAVAIMPKIEAAGWPGDETVKEWRKEYLSIVDEMDDNTIISLLEEFTGDSYIDGEDEIHYRSRPRFIAQKTRGELVDVINDVFDNAFDSRECSLQKIGGRWALITGGMSWGDSPSEHFDAVYLLSNIWWCARGE